jgi:hypothetical protein
MSGVFAFARLMLGSYSSYICAYYNSLLLKGHVQFKGIVTRDEFF